MTQQTGMALADRESERLQRSQQLAAGGEITTPPQLAEKIKQLQGQAHILSPMAAVGSIAPGYVVNPVVVVIDPSVDSESGRGADVYFQRSIHKSNKRGSGRDATYEPLEVSLNKQGLLKILTASGVNVYPTREIRVETDRHSGTYIWVLATDGDIIDFDGRLRRLPSGTASVDLSDGSPDIGEWTPEDWAKCVAKAEEQKAKTPESDRWKCKPEPINGWTKERVLGARKFGYRLAEAKSLNALSRNLGVRQLYAITDLAKPFVIFRPSFKPDMTDPVIRQMVTAANLGARNLMYPGSSAPQMLPQGEHGAPVTHGMGDPTDVIDVDALHDTEPEAPERMQTAAPPSGVEEVAFEEPEAAVKVKADLYHIIRVSKVKGLDQYFIETKEEITLYTPEAALAKACAAASKDGQPREIPTERVMVNDKPYRQVIEVLAAGGQKL